MVMMEIETDLAGRNPASYHALADAQLDLLCFRRQEATSPGGAS